MIYRIKKSAQYSLLIKQLEKNHLPWVCVSKVVFARILKFLKQFVLREQTEAAQIKPAFPLHIFPFPGEDNMLPRFP